MAPHQIWPIGLAMPCPAMSGGGARTPPADQGGGGAGGREMQGGEVWGGEQCTGWNSDGMAGGGFRLALGAMPMVPVQAGPRSLRMSPNRLLATTTSK